jgi:hypothetical protein
VRGQRPTYDGHEYAIARVELALAEGLGLRGRTERLALQVFMLLDGRHTLAELIDLAAEKHGESRERLAVATVPTMRRLFEDGFLIRIAPAEFVELRRPWLDVGRDQLRPSRRHRRNAEGPRLRGPVGSFPLLTASRQQPLLLKVFSEFARLTAVARCADVSV